MKKVVMYTKENCPLCEDAKELLLILKNEVSFSFEEIDIYTDDRLLEKYQLMIPVVEIDGKEVDFGQISIEHILSNLT
ncbi:glutaredoxin family protein [Aquibacillus albus]|uniref:Glutaredoxin n=1 Tax=Aquibacillus albus TaxID=1168171 RepID=A0ABS2MZ31_9BACI|nr:glutaredoxin family protein [Aquibacillus albus]MBM7571053.1 glutaredoxin [Aquibacillus albus]